MTKSKLFVAAIALSTHSRRPRSRSGSRRSRLPSKPVSERRPQPLEPATRDTMAFVPSAKSPRLTVIRTTKGK